MIFMVNFSEFFSRSEPKKLSFSTVIYIFAHSANKIFRGFFELESILFLNSDWIDSGSHSDFNNLPIVGLKTSHPVECTRTPLPVHATLVSKFSTLFNFSLSAIGTLLILIEMENCVYLSLLLLCTC